MSLVNSFCVPTFMSVQTFCHSEWRPWSPHDSVSLSQTSRQTWGHRTQGRLAHGSNPAWQAHQYIALAYILISNSLVPNIHDCTCTSFAAHTGCHAGESWGSKWSEGLWPEGTHWGVTVCVCVHVSVHVCVCVCVCEWKREREREREYKVTVVDILKWSNLCISSDAQPSRACSKGADHLQHLLPWADSPGQRSVCGEGGATGQH